MNCRTLLLGACALVFVGCLMTQQVQPALAAGDAAGNPGGNPTRQIHSSRDAETQRGIRICTNARSDPEPGVSHRVGACTYPGARS